MARKNGKTQLAAAFACARCPGPEGSRGECYSVSLNEISGRAHLHEMVAIITKMPWLNDRINIVSFRKELEDKGNGADVRRLVRRRAPVHGFHLVRLYDELGQVPSRP